MNGLLMKTIIVSLLIFSVTIVLSGCRPSQADPAAGVGISRGESAEQGVRTAGNAVSPGEPHVDPSGKKLKVLFLCTGNSCRSQMAEAWTRKLKSDCIEPYSAGIEKHGLNPNMLQVMKELDVDTSMLQSKLLGEIKGITFDYVITVCSHADENCPKLPKETIVKHIGFDDPPKLAKACTTEEEKLNCYRRVRDEIKKMVETLPEVLTKGTE